MIKFPEGFYFVSATSSTQSEGAHTDVLKVDYFVLFKVKIKSKRS